MILDTNVLSELIRRTPEPKVLAWLQAQAAEMPFTTAVSRGEMLYGVRILPAGQRRDSLLQEVEGIFSTEMANRVLPYDGAAADAHAAIAASCRERGRPISQADAMIAGIVHSLGATLATRNVCDFEACGIPVVDPWH